MRAEEAETARQEKYRDDIEDLGLDFLLDIGAKDALAIFARENLVKKEM